MKVIKAGDLFCGAGGTISGCKDACDDLGLGLDAVAVNHWPTAIETHKASHEFANHICENLDNVNPRKVVPGGKLDMLLASPECIFFSNARGGKPKDEQSRASGWHVQRWAEALRPEVMVIENVREWQKWGPLQDNGHPDPSQKGKTFQGWVTALRSLGYKVDWRVLTCADYGDATTRQRLFILARRKGKIVWPDPTHSKEGDMFVQNRWRTAREVIDWKVEGKSVFQRKKPLCASTWNRLERGIEHFCGVEIVEVRADGFVVRPRGGVNLSPTVMQIDNHSAKGHCSRLVDQPISTVVTKQRHALAVPFLTKYYGTGNNIVSVDEPLHTITTKQRHALSVPRWNQGLLDVNFRILGNPELARAHGMEDFKFSGTVAEVTKQIGNSVPRATAKALCLAQLTPRRKYD